MNEKPTDPAAAQRAREFERRLRRGAGFAVAEEPDEQPRHPTMDDLIRGAAGRGVHKKEREDGQS